ncbi:hypothetical protein V5O48_010480, partial [Marasmius crinis-equi]
IKFNYGIEKKNKERREKDILYIQGQSKQPGLAQASTFSICSVDCKELIKSKQQLQEAKSSINKLLYKALKQQQ